MVSTSFSRIDSVILDVVSDVVLGSWPATLQIPLWWILPATCTPWRMKRTAGDTAARIGEKHGMNQFEWNWEPPGNGRLRWGSPLSGRNNNNKKQYTNVQCTLRNFITLLISWYIMAFCRPLTFFQRSLKKKHPSLRHCCLRPHRHHSEACQFLLFHANSFSCWCRHHLPTVPPRPELVENDSQPARPRGSKRNYMELSWSRVPW